jgi:hypothetical protein
MGQLLSYLNLTCSEKWYKTLGKKVFRTEFFEYVFLNEERRSSNENI